MKRKHFSHTLLGASAMTALGALGCNRKEPEKHRWKMVTSWDRNKRTLYYQGAQDICDYVKKMTGNKFVIELVNNECKPGEETLDKVSKGEEIHCAHTIGAYSHKKNSALLFASTIPFGLNIRQKLSWLYQGGGIDLINEVYSKFGIIAFPAGNTGLQMGGWFKSEVNSLSELKGLRMRIPGLGAEVMQRLGVKTEENLWGKDIADSLRKGKLDAAEWGSPHDDMSIGLNKTNTKHYYSPGWWAPSEILDLQINKRKFEDLPKEYKKILRSACLEVNIRMLARYDELNFTAYQEILNDPRIEQAKFSNDIMKEARKITFDILDEKAGENPDFKHIYEKWNDFRQKIHAWHSFNELLFDAFNAKK